jgi:hypothetical protein
MSASRVLRERHVHLCLAIDQRLEWTTVGAALRHEYLVIAQQDLGVDDLAALWADAPRKFVEDIIRVFLLRFLPGQRRQGRLRRKFAYL